MSPSFRCRITVSAFSSRHATSKFTTPRSLGEAGLSLPSHHFPASLRFFVKRTGGKRISEPAIGDQREFASNIRPFRKPVMTDQTRVGRSDAGQQQCTRSNQNKKPSHG